MMLNRLQPVPVDSGFEMSGFFVWCGSLIRVNDQFHLFASRWPEETGFPDGYRSHSEIVRAVAPNPLGPFVFQEVVLSGRGGDYWDGKMCHNPKIVRIGSRFVLYYIGSAISSGLRKIGYATADSIEGPWLRLPGPIPLGDDANNPAPFIEDNGAVLLAFRDEKLRMHIAQAPSFVGPYTVVSYDIYPAGRLEDPDLSFSDGRYNMVMEDNEGVLTGSVRHGGHLVSSDGITWAPANPVKLYSHTIEIEDGTTMSVIRRERPEMFNMHNPQKSRGEPTHLITAVQSEDGTKCVVQSIAPAN